jgi:hypothetical protein
MHANPHGFTLQNSADHSSCYPEIALRCMDMKLLLLISNAFINTMGITQPSPEAAKRAAWFIVAMLFAVAAAIATIAFLAIHWASHP